MKDFWNKMYSYSSRKRYLMNLSKSKNMFIPNIRNKIVEPNKCTNCYFSQFKITTWERKQLKCKSLNNTN